MESWVKGFSKVDKNYVSRHSAMDVGIEMIGQDADQDLHAKSYQNICWKGKETKFALRKKESLE